MFLLLQGPSSLFFSHLGDALDRCGARVLRIHLCPGDALFWRRGGAQHFRGGAADWPGHLRWFIAKHRVTDIALLGDQRDRHHAAVEVARDLGVRIHAIELGYLRPGWLTVEPDGGGGASRFPKNRGELRRLSVGAEDSGPPPAGGFISYAVMDIAWNLANLALSWRTHPEYRRHATWHPLIEYAGWALKPLRAAMRRQVTPPEAPFFLAPLQLATDFQIRAHSDEGDMGHILKKVIDTFAQSAPRDAHLLIKAHPMDNDWTPWARIAARAAVAAGCGDRVRTVSGGDLDQMIARAEGIVTVNSTVGLSALLAGRPVKALGRAIYDTGGLTDQRSLAAFFRAPVAPDPEFAEEFADALKATIQVRGAFDGPGVRIGAENMAARMMAPPPY